jgi:hypothetical protein
MTGECELSQNVCECVSVSVNVIEDVSENVNVSRNVNVGVSMNVSVSMNVNVYKCEYVQV